MAGALSLFRSQLRGCLLERPSKACSSFSLLPLMSSPPITPSVLGTLASLLFLEHVRHTATSGPLHVLSPLPGMLEYNHLLH